jgi:hypothetical protein
MLGTVTVLASQRVIDLISSRAGGDGGSFA